MLAVSGAKRLSLRFELGMERHLQKEPRERMGSENSHEPGRVEKKEWSTQVIWKSFLNRMQHPLVELMCDHAPGYTCFIFIGGSLRKRSSILFKAHEFTHIMFYFLSLKQSITNTLMILLKPPTSRPIRLIGNVKPVKQINRKSNYSSDPGTIFLYLFPPGWNYLMITCGLSENDFKTVDQLCEEQIAQLQFKSVERLLGLYL